MKVIEMQISFLIPTSSRGVFICLIFGTIQLFLWSVTVTGTVHTNTLVIFTRKEIPPFHLFLSLTPSLRISLLSSRSSPHNSFASWAHFSPSLWSWISLFCTLSRSPILSLPHSVKTASLSFLLLRTHYENTVFKCKEFSRGCGTEQGSSDR